MVRHDNKHKIQEAYNKKKQRAAKTKTNPYAFPKQRQRETRAKKIINQNKS